MRKNLLALAALLGLTACGRIDAWLHPYDDKAPLQAVPAAPGKGQIEAYSGTDGALLLEVKPGDCAKLACYEFIKGRWKPLPAANARGLALLGVDSATGSAYDAGLWHPVGHGAAILVNAGAGEQNIAAGRFGGLRIGLQSKGEARYVTAFALDGNRVTPITASVVTTEGRAWLVQTRADSGVNMVELFAIPQTPTMHCLPDLAIETAPWAGPLETAQTPDRFVSRAVDPSRAEAERAAVHAACATKPKS